MRKFLYALTSIIGVACIIVTYNYFNTPRSEMVLHVPSHTLERLGFNDRDLLLMLSDDRSCKHQFVKHYNNIVMFGETGTWGDVKLMSKIVSLYPTWQDIWQLTDEIHLCIRSKDEWEPVWKGKFSLKGSFNLYLTHMSFFCNKKNSSSKWECSGYENHDKKEEIYKLLTKYNEKSAPNK